MISWMSSSVNPGTPERERFREEARIYVNGYAQTAECKNSQKKRK